CLLRSTSSCGRRCKSSRATRSSTLPGRGTWRAVRPGRSATCRMRKRAAAWACHPGEYQVNWEIQALDQTAGYLRDDPVGVAALWDTISQLAGEPRPPEAFPYVSPDL